MQRDFIIVSGMQGYGKTVWTQQYAASKSRLLVYDPKAEYRNVDFVSNPEEYIPAILRGETQSFRYGTYWAEEVELFGSTAYAARNTTLVLEECKMLFDRGEDIAPWARPVIYMGREPQLNLVLVAQRCVAIPPDIRSQATRIVTFLQTEKNDVKWLSEKFGGVAFDGENADWETRVRTLPALHCLDWQAGQGIKSYAVHP